MSNFINTKAQRLRLANADLAYRFNNLSEKIQSGEMRLVDIADAIADIERTHKHMISNICDGSHIRPTAPTTRRPNGEAI